MDDGTRIARRKLLKMGVWAAPAVIGAAAMSRQAAAVSCGPTGCTPNCQPNGGPCEPVCGPNRCAPAG